MCTPEMADFLLFDYGHVVFGEVVSGPVFSEDIGGTSVLPHGAGGSGGYDVYIGGCIEMGCGEL